MNRFFTKEDKKLDIVGNFSLPKTWWSRPYEYAYCIDQLKEKDVVMDAGCGIEHPFKFEASNICKKVVAVDRDLRINNIQKTSSLEFVCSDLQSIDTNRKFDKIFCISVIEHLPVPVIKNVLKQFKESLKKDGKIILTIDYPTIKPAEIINIALQEGLVLESEFINNKEEAYFDPHYKLAVFALELILDREGEKDGKNDKKEIRKGFKRVP